MSAEEDAFAAFWHAHSARSPMRHELVRYDDLVAALHRDVASSVNSVTVNEKTRLGRGVILTLFFFFKLHKVDDSVARALERSVPHWIRSAGVDGRRVFVALLDDELTRVDAAIRAVRVFEWFGVLFCFCVWLIGSLACRRIGRLCAFSASAQKICFARRC